MSAPVEEVLPQQVPSTPRWPEVPPLPDPTGTSFSIISIGPKDETARVAERWAIEAQAIAATTMIRLDSMEQTSNRTALANMLNSTYTGVRVMVVGSQYDVIISRTIARDCGMMIPEEVASFVIDTRDSPVYCAHCRTTFRAEAAPGDLIRCAGCTTTLQVHEHFASALGSFLGSKHADQGNR